MQVEEILDGDQVVGINIRDARRFSDFEQQLNQNPQIRMFTITNSEPGLSAEDCCALVRRLAAFDNLTKLDLNVEKFNDGKHDAGEALALLLRRNELKQLALFGDVSDLDAFFEPIHDALRANTSLQHLSIYCQNFGNGILANLATVINIKGRQGFTLTLNGLSSYPNNPIEIQIGFDYFLNSIANVLNFTEVNVIAYRYVPSYIAAYNAIMPVQALKKKLQQRIRDNYRNDLRTVAPSIDNSLLALPDYQVQHIMEYVPGLHMTLKLVYPECKTDIELHQQLVRDIYQARSEILFANTVREQVLGVRTIRTGLYFDANRRMQNAVASPESTNPSSMKGSVNFGPCI